MSKYQFIISAGPENPVRATRSVMFATKAVDDGHEVSLFLVDDAVYLTNPALTEHVRAATGDTLMQYLQVILDQNIEVMVCLPCAKARGINESALPSHWRLAKGIEV
ncbi:MAG: DsrE family protein, partial [Proteobacteria bacterium]|nr:DsrE family protein [Pseudomonadota bacterium]